MSLHPEIIEAIQVAARFGFISEKIFRDFICASKRAMIYRVWRQIRDSGFFAPMESALGTNSYLKLTRLGKSLALRMSLSPIQAPFIQQLAHDEALVRFALANEKALLIKKALPETYLKSSPYEFADSFAGATRKIPDLYFSLNVPDKKIRIALEFERTRKTQIRYRSILMSYAAFREAELVLFIVNDEAIEKTIRGTALRMKYPQRQRPLAYALADDVDKDPTGFPLKLQNRTLRFNEFVQELRDLKAGAA